LTRTRDPTTLSAMKLSGTSVVVLLAIASGCGAGEHARGPEPSTVGRDRSLDPCGSPAPAAALEARRDHFRGADALDTQPCPGRGASQR
jgi:hypothetical protein